MTPDIVFYVALFSIALVLLWWYMDDWNDFAGG